MSPRTALHIGAGVLIAVIVVFTASSMQTGTGGTFSDILKVQTTTPIIWVVDFLAAAIIFASWFFPHMISRFKKIMENQSEQYQEQLDSMIERASEADNINDEYATKIEMMEEQLVRQQKDYGDQISTLEQSAKILKQILDVELRQLTSHSMNMLQVPLEANMRQMEAMSMSMQLHRGEVRKIRHDIHEIQAHLAHGDHIQVTMLDLEAEVNAIPPVSSAVSNGMNILEAATVSEQEADPQLDIPMTDQESSLEIDLSKEYEKDSHLTFSESHPELIDSTERILMPRKKRIDQLLDSGSPSLTAS